MVNPNRYYTYAYLRKDGTPYYIGKGQKNRIYVNSGKPCGKPKDKSRIIFLKQNLTEEEAFKHEKYMIAIFGRKDLGTGILHNRTDGGDGCSGLIHSKETKKKISEIHKGKTLSEETKKKIGISSKNRNKGKNNPMYGKSPSKETRIKISEALKGEKHFFYKKSISEETRKKLSEANSGKNHPRYGKSVSEETRMKISEANKGENNAAYGKKWWNNGYKNKRSIECPGEGWIAGLKKSKKSTLIF